MNVIIIRVKRIGDSISSDLRSLGFVQVNIVSYCYGRALTVVYNNIGSRNDNDIIIADPRYATEIITTLKRNGMYISHREVDGMVSQQFIDTEQNKCELVTDKR